MLKITKKLTLNLKTLRFLILPTILVSTTFFNKVQDANAGLEFQWNQDSVYSCLLYTSPSPRDRTRSRMPSSA